jgi:molecular chaperone GrpE
LIYPVSMNTNPEENDVVIDDEGRANAAGSSRGGADDTLDDSVVAEEVAGDTIKKLREKLKQAEAEKQEYLTGWQRAKADMVNARKRDDEERKEFTKYANENLIADLMPVLDSFDMAMGNREAWEKADKNWRMGVEYIYSQLVKALTDNGLKEIDPKGEKYDHALHEAISNEPVTDEKQGGMIIAVIQKGYSLNGKLLKVPKVKVGEYVK